jgi:C4-dicarboxylate-specific signal transduction histidine kinase
MAATPLSRRVITLRTRATRQGTVELLVRDRGSGIRPEEAARLFKPFHTTKVHGLGLGLTICSTIAHAHGGKLTLADADGGGARAVLSLPGHEMLMAAQ